jgi:nitrite reductase (NO-forming)
VATGAGHDRQEDKMIAQQVSDITASKMNRRLLLKRAGLMGLTLPAAGMLLNACRTDEPVTQTPLTPATAAQGAPTVAAQTIANSEVTELTVTAVDLAFQPTELTAIAGQKVRLTFVNNGAMEHDWQVPAVKAHDLTIVEKSASFNDRMQGLLDQGSPYAGAGAGETMVVEFEIEDAGSYEFICAVPGHAMAGMKGTFTVTGGDHTAAAPTAAAATHTADGHSMSTGTKTGTPYAADRLPLPAVAPPVGKREPQLLTQEIEIREVVGYMDEGVAYEFWTFGGTIPGPMIRVRVGDTVELTLKNPAESMMTHNIDLHAVTGPGGGGKVTLVAPGQSATFRFKALNPGVYVYHCATPPIPQHISSGMYGLIVVEPEGGLPEVDREFYVMQGDFYLEGARGEQGLRPFSMDKMLDEHPDYVVFNGGVGSIAEDRAFKAKVGETIRIFFGVGGPNIVSSFHVIGEIFDQVMQEGATEWSSNIQTTLVPAGGATIVDFKVEVPSTLMMVDHSLGRLAKGAVGMIVVEGDANPEVFEVVTEAH